MLTFYLCHWLCAKTSLHSMEAGLAELLGQAC